MGRIQVVLLLGAHLRKLMEGFSLKWIDSLGSVVKVVGCLRSFLLLLQFLWGAIRSVICCQTHLKFVEVPHVQ